MSIIPIHICPLLSINIFATIILTVKIIILFNDNISYFTVISTKLIAKNNKTHEYLAQQIKDRLIEKKYLAIAKGRINYDFGTIDYPIGRNPRHPEKMAVVEDGKPSLTGFDVLKKFREATYIELDLKTGRTHQIRVHLSKIGYPIIGDEVYSNGKNEWGIHGQCLHAKSLKFKHPINNKEMYIEAELPEYFQEIIKKCKQ